MKKALLVLLAILSLAVIVSCSNGKETARIVKQTSKASSVDSTLEDRTRVMDSSAVYGVWTPPTRSTMEPEIDLTKMSGLNEVLPKIYSISAFQPFDKEIYYVNYEGVDSKGTGRTTCYDMGNYISYLYKSYVKNPSTYQNLINSLAYSDVESPLASSFAPDTKILHMYGRNNSLKAYTEVAIIDTYEPIAVCIYVESANKNDVVTAFSTIGKHVNDYISACYQ